MVPRIGLSLMVEDDFREATLPLFADGLVDALEWSFDSPTDWLEDEPRPLPDWVEALLAHYGAQGRLYAHGVHHSLLSAHDDGLLRRRRLVKLRSECARHRHRHLTEHFGFMTTPSFARSAPLPVPMSKTAIDIGRERLVELAEASGVPIGVENLAFAFCRRDVDEQGAFLEALLEPFGKDGFLLLDLHNLWCQLANFDDGLRAPDEILSTYPLHRVREVHLSGGSWSSPDGRLFRRDTHDGPVPDEVFELLARVLPRCPELEAVIVERLGDTLSEETEREGLRRDFERARLVVAGGSPR